MRLDGQELAKYRELIEKIARTQCLLHPNGIFEIFNIDENEANQIVAALKQKHWVADAHATQGRINFNKISSIGMPGYYYNIRGILKDDIITEELIIHRTLNPKLWDDEQELLPEVREKIYAIVERFKDLLGLDNIELKVEDIYLLGSNANYNYTDESDLDIHIIADENFDCSEEHLPIIYNAYKSLFNSKYDIKIRGIDAEIYVENKDKLSNISTGVYSLKDGWLKEPKAYKIPKIDDTSLDKQVQFWENKYYDIIENPSVKSIDMYIDSLYDLRTSAITQKGEFGEGNLIFKEIRRRGYLDSLKELKTALVSRELSLESLTVENAGLKKIYNYIGPVWHFNDLISREWEGETLAESPQKALNNLAFKARKEFGFVPNSKIHLDLKYLKSKNISQPLPTQKTCDRCGQRLNDAGECPLCDLGDDSILDENVR